MTSSSRSLNDDGRPRRPGPPANVPATDVDAADVRGDLEVPCDPADAAVDHVRATDGRGAAPFGVYVHVPFCATRCDYCAFATWTDRHHLQHAYLDACRTEIGRAVAGGLPAATSVFVGGGTPSLVAPELLVAVLEAVPVAPGCEMTVECNPDTITPELVAAYAAGGVNRISLGVQSMVDHVLAALGRTHDTANVRRAVELVRAGGIEEVNLDLIYGGAGESLDDWRRTVDGALELDPPHISAYALTVEPGTLLADDASRHPDDDDQAEKYLLAAAAFEDAGLAWYEISNWARPGSACRHNQLYWSMGDYQAFGCAGHSHRHGRRFWNVRTPERYIDAVTAGRSPEAAGERLDAEERRLEALQLAVRTRTGVPTGALPLDDGEHDESGAVGELAGLVDVMGDRAVLTLRGRLLANEVALRLR